ncbi:hypothetical protein ACTOB_002204 [Actinoplanes oblitus]|uniref:Uncharacterized protein n=1 Tax=Actinoplanes oblitus TaxID=3040509 RepID=A0ABY8WNZ8_9ACTN|nr:hypothetical protein [Actinoplanes oblitus]WIM98600.1 hypothetical protein ACTOB_002204 [Actinoplanes oblitus]
MSLAVAIGVAAVFAVFGFPFTFYQCWFSWTRAGALGGFLLYLTLAGGGGGLLGWTAAYLADVPPFSNPALGGLFYGIAGAFAVRADFRTSTTTSTGLSSAGRGSHELRTAASLLGKGIEWSTGLLNAVTRRQVKSWLAALTDDQLLGFTYDLVHELQESPAIPANGRTAIGKKAVDAMGALTTAATHAEGRSQLTHFCLRQVVDQHIPKPGNL